MELHREGSAPTACAAGLFLENLNLKEYQNLISVSRVIAILLNGRNFPIGQCAEDSGWRVCYQRGLPFLVFKLSKTTRTRLTFTGSLVNCAYLKKKKEKRGGGL